MILVDEGSKPFLLRSFSLGHKEKEPGAQGRSARVFELAFIKSEVEVYDGSLLESYREDVKGDPASFDFITG